MEIFPIIDLFREVGRVQIRQEGLYLAFSAEVWQDRPGFLRLYHCNLERTVRLGLFFLAEGRLQCHGRISLRSLGDWKNGVFSTENVTFLPLEEPLHGGSLPENAILVQKNGRQFAAVCRQNCLPEGIMPYFCFLTPMEIGGIPCLGFEIDEERKPVFSAVMQE